MKRSTLFSEEDSRLIEAAIQAAEKRTSGEIVVLALPASDDYRWVPWLWTGIGITVATAVVVVISLGAHWPLPVWRLLEWQLVGVTAGAAFSLLPGIRRRSIPRAAAARRVHRECMANFVAAGLHETRDRTGVLVFLSELEHRVEILADRGIHSHVGEHYWREQVDGIVRGIRAGRAGEAVATAVAAIGDKLAEHFPPRHDDRNELADGVLHGPQGDR